MNQARIIFHVDMNSFFASVEVAHNPKLKGKPLAIAGNPEERRGIIVTSTYEARAKGVKTTMPIWQAKKLCPNLLILPPNGERYRTASQAIFDILFSYTPLVQQVSIDEGYMDVTSYSKEIHPLQLAKEVQARIFEELRLPCSIGIAPNKFLAKMASDMKKPNGITVLRKRDIDSMLWQLPIEQMHGIGKRTVDTWKKHEIHKIGDLAKADKQKLVQKFGERGLQLWSRANGIDVRPVNPHAYKEFKSIGHSTTLRADTDNLAVIQATFDQLALRVNERLKKNNVYARGVQITIRYHDWKMVTKSHKVEHPIQSIEDLRKEARLLFDKGWNHERIRLLGISTYDLVDQQYAYKQLDLFTYKADIKKDQLKTTIEKIRERYGSDSLNIGWKKQKGEQE